MKRGAKIVRKKKSQMFGIEYSFLLGFVLLILVIVVISSERWSASFRIDKASSNAKILAAASDEVYAAGPGSVKCVAINNPKGVVSGRAAGNEIIFVLQARGQDNEIASTTKSRSAGAIPISEGQAIVCVRNGMSAGDSSSDYGSEDSPINTLYPNGATEEEGDGCIPLSGDPDCSNTDEFNLGTTGQCGDGISDSGEACEIGISCGAGQSCNQETCTCDYGAGNVCGDQITEAGEQCDGSSIAYCFPSSQPRECCPPPYQSTCVYAQAYCLNCGCQYDYPDLHCPSGKIEPGKFNDPPKKNKPDPPSASGGACGSIQPNPPSACISGQCPPDSVCRSGTAGGAGTQALCMCVPTTCGDETYNSASETCDQSGGDGSTGCPDTSSCNTACTACEAPDSDFDGLSDLAEEDYGTNDMLWDTDGDGVSDGFEAYYSMNPLEQDTDSDTVLDYDDSNPYDDNDNDGDSIPNSRDPGPLDPNNP